MRKTIVILAALTGTFAAAGAMAAGYPSKPVQVILPWPPLATSTDVIARKVIEGMEQELKGKFTIVNKPGGAGVIGTKELTDARPDGYTLGGLTIGPAVSQIAAGNTPYKIADLQPIGIFATLPFLILARKDAPFDDVASLAKHAKTAPKPIVLAHWGKATVPTLSTYRLAAGAGFAFNEVAYAKVDTSQLLNGDADLAIVPLTAALSSIKAGQTKAIVALTPSRMPALPDLKTVREQGFNFDVSIWTGLFAPKGTPADVVAKLTKALQAATKRPEIVKFVNESGAILYYADADATKAQMQSEYDAFRAELVRLKLAK